MPIDYSTVTEVQGSQLSREQLERMCARYYFAGEYCEAKDVLEVACGAGQGLGYLAAKAKRIVGGDCTPSLVKSAQRYYGERLEVLELDAHELPFANDSFDVIILFEAIYYLHDVHQFLRECRRVLRADGLLLIGSANKDREGFSPSPHSVAYYSAPELNALLTEYNFTVEMRGDCPVQPKGLRGVMIHRLMSLAARLRLMPKTMKGKAILKRIFMGKLVPQPKELRAEMAPYTRPVPIAKDRINHEFKVLFAVGHCRGEHVS